MAEFALGATSPPRPGWTPRPWGLKEIGVAVLYPLAILALALAVTLAVDTSTQDVSDADVIAGLIISLVVIDGGLAALVWGLAMVRCGGRFADLGFRRMPLDRLWIAAGLVVFAYAVVVAWQYLLLPFGVTPEQDTETLVQSPAVLPLSAFAVIIVAPLVEEMFFRGFVFGGLVSRIGWAPAALASGVLFGAVHGNSPDALPLIVPFTLIGAAFAWGYYRTGSLWVSVAAHFLFNTISFSLLAVYELT
ncbi:MAG TPA: type II CAAX endopeptidase family protein [Dehalococcoidia bacterium]|nr:type II CAAX endopeptidase family protein [Dehalococcoidia bacterium]